MNWQVQVDRYLSQNPETPGSVRRVLVTIRESGPSALEDAMDHATASAEKERTTHFFLSMVGSALDDHMLTRDELVELRVLRLVFRIEEGDLLRYHQPKVAELLCQEAALIFADDALSVEEELQEARLQEALGLGYDEFIDLVEPEVDALFESLHSRLRDKDPDVWVGVNANEMWNRLNALSLARYVLWRRQGRLSRTGFIYVLTNPSMPGMVKVGRTSHPPSKRAEVLTSATGVPTPFEVVFELPVADQFAAEAYVHKVLEERGVRVSGNREFFAVGPDEAIQLMFEARDVT